MSLWALLGFLAVILGLVLRTEGDATPEADPVADTDDTPAEPKDPQTVALEKAEAAAISELDIEEPAPPKVADPDADSDTTGDEIPPGDDDKGAEPTDEVAGFDDAIVGEAQELGFTTEEIKASGSDTALQKLLNMAQAVSTPSDEATEKGDEAPKADDKKPADADVKTVEFEPFKLELNPELYDPELVKQIQGMNEHYGQQMQSFADTVKKLEAAEVARSSEVFNSWFDSRVEALDDSYESLLGKGDGASLERNGPEFANRVKVIKRMNVIDAGRERMNLPSLDENTLFEEAVASVFRKEGAAVIRKKIAAQVKKRGRSLSARPTSRTATDVRTPTEIAETHVSEKLREFGAGGKAEDAGL